MQVFVTVGTTRFDALVSEVCGAEVQKQLSLRGYTELVVQAGQSQPTFDAGSPLSVHWFDYKPSIREDLESADLVISHAGAGTCLETLQINKPLIVVVNDELMGNHQVELAERLSQDNNLFYCTPAGLSDLISSFDISSLRPYRQGNPALFAAHLDKVLGVESL